MGVSIGQSIGGAFCLSAAANSRKKDIKGFIIDSSFDSFIEIAKSKVPFLPTPIVSSLISDKFSPVLSTSRLRKIPKLFIHGTQDSIIPFPRGEQLFRKSSPPKKMLTIEGGDHLSFFMDRNPNDMREIQNFLDHCIKV